MFKYTQQLLKVQDRPIFFNHFQSSNICFCFTVEPPDFMKYFTLLHFILNELLSGWCQDFSSRSFGFDEISICKTQEGATERRKEGHSPGIQTWLWSGGRCSGQVWEISRFQILALFRDMSISLISLLGSSPLGYSVSGLHEEV